MAKSKKAASMRIPNMLSNKGTQSPPISPPRTGYQSLIVIDSSLPRRTQKGA